jgi:hypothetical protein
MSDGSLRRVSFGELDTVVDARRCPADFWGAYTLPTGNGTMLATPRNQKSAAQGA